MYRYIIRRILLIIPTVLLAGTLCFFLLRVLPGDVVTALTSEGGASAETKAKLREDLGLNDPIIVQYGRWVLEVAQGNLGYSHFQDRPVSETVIDKMETTLTMAVLSMVISLGVAIPLGVISAVKRGSVYDQIIRVVTASALAIPPFWLGIMIVLTAIATSISTNVKALVLFCIEYSLHENCFFITLAAQFNGNNINILVPNFSFNDPYKALVLVSFVAKFAL